MLQNGSKNLFKLALPRSQNSLASKVAGRQDTLKVLVHLTTIRKTIN